MKEEKKNEQQGNATQEAAPKKKWKKVVGGVLTVILVLIVLAGIFLVVQVKKSKKPFIFGYATYYVLSGSMEPTIMTHDVIIIEKVNDPSDLEKGDIVTFVSGPQYNGMVVTHRIVSDGVVDGKFTTRGDNKQTNFKDDDPTPYENVIGKYVKTSRFLTTVYSLFSSKYGFLFFVFIPLLILLGVQVFNFRRACRMDKDGKLPEEKSADEIKEQAVKQKEEEIKRKAVEEYLAAKKRLEKASKENKKN